ncbi:MAG TPA: tetratricopeptide repeat protein [Thermoanaerobaculia bacterium]|nr:tetratricopeptide repeat protein [Thermoanaerobaculia bacterium]
MKRFVAPLLFLLLPAALVAQAPQTAPAKPLSAAEQSADEALKLMQSGDLAGAVQKLEPIRRDASANPRLIALLGTLYLQVNRPQDAFDVLKALADAPEADPAVLYQAGRAALLVGQTPIGNQYLVRSLEKEPSSPAARDLGILMSRTGKVVEAYSLLRPWVLRNPTDADARILAASLAVQLERPEEAEQMLSGMPENDPALQLLRGRVRVQKGDGPGALALLKPVLANHPANVDLEVRRAAAEAYLLAGQPAEAVKLLEGKTGSVPSLVLLLGKAQHKAGNTAAALATLKPLADKLPDDPAKVGDPRPAVGVAVEYGSLLVAGGRAAEAVPVLEKATRLFPGSRDAWQGYAQALDAAGRKAEAQTARAKTEEIAKAAAAKPARTAAAAPASSAPAPVAPAAPLPPPSATLQEAVRLTTEGQPEKALELARREIASSPTDQRSRALEVRLLLLLQRNQEALKSADAALSLEPSNPNLIYQRGAAYMAVRNFQAAEDDFRRALELAPRHTAAMSDLAVLLIQRNRKDEARQLFERVLQINPQDPNAAAALAQLKGGGQ